jgi:hypothetical protein
MSSEEYIAAESRIVTTERPEGTVFEIVDQGLYVDMYVVGYNGVRTVFGMRSIMKM